MSYTKEQEPVPIAIPVAAQISATATRHGPVFQYAGEIMGATVASPSNHSGDNASNHYLISVHVHQASNLSNSTIAGLYNTATTPLNANARPFTMVTTTARRFNTNDQLRLVFTRTGTAVNFPPEAIVHVWVTPVYAHSITG